MTSELCGVSQAVTHLEWAVRPAHASVWEACFQPFVGSLCEEPAFNPSSGVRVRSTTDTAEPPPAYRIKHECPTPPPPPSNTLWICYIASVAPHHHSFTAKQTQCAWPGTVISITLAEIGTVWTSIAIANDDSTLTVLERPCHSLSVAVLVYSLSLVAPCYFIFPSSVSQFPFPSVCGSISIFVCASSNL